MNIAYDIFLLHPEASNKLNYEEDIMFKELLLFVQAILSPLQNEIETEDLLKENDEDYTGTVIELLNPNGIIIKHHNYNSELTGKMRQLISNADFSKFNTDILTHIASINN